MTSGDASTIFANIAKGAAFTAIAALVMLFILYVYKSIAKR